MNTCGLAVIHPGVSCTSQSSAAHLRRSNPSLPLREVYSDGSTEHSITSTMRNVARGHGQLSDMLSVPFVEGVGLPDLLTFGVGAGLERCRGPNTVAGRGGRGWQDGEAGQAKLAAPRGLWRCSDGSILVADSGNHCLRLLSPVRPSAPSLENSPHVYWGNILKRRNMCSVSVYMLCRCDMCGVWRVLVWMCVHPPPVFSPCETLFMFWFFFSLENCESQEIC